MGRCRFKQVLDRPALACLKSGRLQLRQPQLNDARQVYRYAADPRASRFLAWSPHRDEVETRQFLRGCIEAWHNEARLP